MEAEQNEINRKLYFEAQDLSRHGSFEETEMKTSPVFEITAISAGEGNGWQFSAECLRNSVPLWEGVEIFIDHHNGPGRSLRDLAGIGFQASFDEAKAAIQLKLRPSGPSGRLLQAVGSEWLAAEQPRPKLGFSADVIFSADGQNVKEILKVISLDLVYRPARGGIFNRVLNQLTIKKESMMNQVEETIENHEESAASERQAVQDTLLQAKQTLLALKLQESRLPEASQAFIRKQFQDKTDFDAQEIADAILNQRELLAAFASPGGIQSAGRIEEMKSGRERLQAAADDLLGAGREKSMQGMQVERLSGIRELYLLLTGDREFRGQYQPQHIQLADSDSLANVLKNSFNKIMLQQWEELGKAGYRWWEKVCQIEHMSSLQQVSGILLGEVSALSAVSEGASYAELGINDSGESKNFTKYGGLLPLTIEMMDKDETHKLRQIPNKLVASAVRNISGLVSGLFTSSSGTGPIMSDGFHVFDAANHGNLGTAALTAASFEAASQAVYEQGMISTDGTKPRLAVDARYLLVPRALRLTAMRILYPSFERESNIFSENMLRGELGDVITVPDWSDANDWAAMADPRLAPGIVIAERFGIMPEIFVSDQEQSFDIVHSDTINLKVRHFLAVFAADYRPLYKANVA